MSWQQNLANIPVPNKRRMAVHVKPAAERALRGGHPWLFEDGITDMSFEGAAGDLAVVFDSKDKFLAVGLYDPDSPIRVKVLQHNDPATINGHWFAGKLRNAVALREPLRGTDTDGYRLVYGENDGLPGFVVDRYADTLVLKVYTAAWFPYLREIVPLLLEVQAAERVILRLSRNVAAGETFGLSDGVALVGDVLRDPVLFRENGLWFAADVVAGHKTGFFFDQRENRARVGALSDGAAVLDVFAYAGGFSLYAARGGAKRVVSVDISGPALETAQANFALNADDPKVAAAQHETRVGDAFEILADMRLRGEQFDVVVIDPPSFAKREAEIESALRSYAQLAELGAAVTREGGEIVLASCSSRVRPDVFYNIVTRSVGRTLTNVRKHGHALDHPVGFPEGEYLKCLYATVAP